MVKPKPVAQCSSCGGYICDKNHDDYCLSYQSYIHFKERLIIDAIIVLLVLITQLIII